MTTDLGTTSVPEGVQLMRAECLRIRSETALFGRNDLQARRLQNVFGSGFAEEKEPRAGRLLREQV